MVGPREDSPSQNARGHGMTEYGLRAGLRNGALGRCARGERTQVRT